MREFLIDNLFAVWVIATVLFVPRLKWRPGVGSAVAALSGVVVLAVLYYAGYGELVYGGLLQYSGLVLFVVLVTSWHLHKRARASQS